MAQQVAPWLSRSPLLMRGHTVATIRKIDGKRGTVYRAIIRRKGQTLSKTFRIKSDAAKWSAKKEAEIERAQAGLIYEGHRRKLAEAIDRYISEILPSKSVGTQESYGQQLTYWKGALGEYKLADLTPALVSQCRDELRAENIAPKGKPERHRGPATVNRYLEALGSIFSAVIKQWHWLPDTPMRAVAKLKEPRGRTRFLSDAELTALLAACKEARESALYLAVLLALTTGARKGNVMHLRWEQVDIDKAVWHIPKTKNGDPMMLALVPKVVRLLKERREQGGVVRLQGLVFPSKVSDEQPVLIEAAWRAAKKRAGISNLRFHDLRHTAASYLAMNGASLPEIGNVLGHRSAQSTNRYAHMVQGHTHSLVRDTMSKRLGGGDDE